MSASKNGEGSKSSQVVSLRKTLREAVFVGAEDILASRCVDVAARCSPGDVFVPRVSAASDEHEQIDEAVRRGATAVVAERLLPVNIPQCLVEDSNEAFAILSQQLAGGPSQRVLTIGVIGTNGKTTTSLFISSVLKRLGGSVAYYTSLGSSDSIECDRTNNRPPSAGQLASWMKKSLRAEAPALVIELTESMLKNRSTQGIEFDVLVVCGLRPNQVRGGATSRRLTELLTSATKQLKDHGVLLYNADDAAVSRWVERGRIPAVSYGLDAAEHVRGKRLGRAGGQQQVLVSAGYLLMPMTLDIPGDHVARAALASVALAWMFDLSVADAIAGAEALRTIPGRMERVHQAVDVPLFIDRGQTPDRLAAAMHAMRTHGLGATTVVCDVSSELNDATRTRLGEVLQKGASQVVLSGATVGAEALQRLAMDVLGGFAAPGRVQVIGDREAAIAWAINNTTQGCIVLSGCGEREWVGRNGQMTTDQATARHLYSKRSQPLVFPNLKIFPPSEPTAFFPIDSTK
ncbi:MAG: hypothetical protein KDB03_06435 [Planctomycetales bacterium]|nr:hypothetical protein [Planctomycetales bacterium]